MASLSPTSATTTCGACGADCGGDHANQDPGDFCASCGHALVEDCFKCGHRVGLEQKFCGKCGVNLAQRVDRRRGEFEQQLTRAVAETKSHRFDDALDLLSRLTNEGDYRFADLRENAIQAAEKIRLLKSQTTDQVAKRIAAAAHADAQGLRNRVVEILSTVPEPMLDDPSRTRLQTAKAEMADIAHTRKTLTESLDAKKWRDAGLAIGRLLTLEPENDGVKKLARKISGRAVATADALVARGSIDRAIGYLESIPPVCQNDDVDAMLENLRRVDWMSRQFEKQIFATEPVRELAVRFVRECPQHPVAQSLKTRLSGWTAAANATELGPPIDFDDAADRRQSIYGGRIVPITVPRSIDFSTVPIDKFASGGCSRGESTPGEYTPGGLSVACGAAMAGLDKFSPPKRDQTGVRFDSVIWRKKTRLGGWGKKSATVWGLAIGTDGVVAVALRRGDDDAVRFVATDVRYQRHQTPLHTISVAGDRVRTVRETVTKIAGDNDVGGDGTGDNGAGDNGFGGAPVFVSIPATDFIAHHVRLPPVPTKQLSKLLEAEAASRIPLKEAEIYQSHFLGDVAEGSIGGTPAFILASRKVMLDPYHQTLASLGVNVTAIIAEPVAMLNFMNVECADAIAPADEASGNTEPCVSMIDVGADTTKIYFLGQSEFWFGNVGVAGQAATVALIKASGLTRDDAEQAKKSPAKMADPSGSFESLDGAWGRLRSQLIAAGDEANKVHPRIRSVQTHVCGGAWSTHNLIAQAIVK